MKEQIHLLQLKNNQVTSEIKRQRTINQARQDEIVALQTECSKKDREALDLKGQLDGIVSDTYTSNVDAERQKIENENVLAQNQQQEDRILQTRIELTSLHAEMDRLREEHRQKEELVRQKQSDVQRKREVLVSTQAEIRRLEAEMGELSAEHSNLNLKEKNILQENRHVEKNFYAEQKRQEDLQVRHNALRFECEQLQVRKAEVVHVNDRLSENLKQSIERTESLKLELNATENLVLQYENQNQRLMQEIED
jgi:hypothetical protein